MEQREMTEHNPFYTIDLFGRVFYCGDRIAEQQRSGSWCVNLLINGHHQPFEISHLMNCYFHRELNYTRYDQKLLRWKELNLSKHECFRCGEKFMTSTGLFTHINKCKKNL